MLFSDLYKTMANKTTFVGFKAGDSPNRPLDPPLPQAECFAWFPFLVIMSFNVNESKRCLLIRRNMYFLLTFSVWFFTVEGFLAIDPIM